MKSLTTLLLLLAPVVASASTISDIVVFGDSLSDNGNLYKATVAAGLPAMPPSPPYFNGRYSNGPLAVEDFAGAEKLPLIDYAFAGATTGLGVAGDPGGSVTSVGTYSLPGMQAQFAAYAKAMPVPVTSSAFVVWGGPDDLLAPAAADAGNPVAIANTAAANILKIVDGLAAMGAPEIIVPGVPDLALVPDYSSNPIAANLFANTFNADVVAGLPKDATYVNTFALLQQIVAGAPGNGFTNATTPCLNAATLVPCSNPNQYVFWDGKHPTAAAQALIAQQFEAVPEPSMELVTFVILGGLGLARWRSRARDAA